MPEEEEEVEPLYKRGDVRVDTNGQEWYIISVSYREGRPEYSEVLVGSLAHQLIVKRE